MYGPGSGYAVGDGTRGGAADGSFTAQVRAGRVPPRTSSVGYARRRTAAGTGRAGGVAAGAPGPRRSAVPAAFGGRHGGRGGNA
ncbi:hypothetical protein GCM10009802_49370 [Streptomyces synnematoformans]|uniref:Uncharacterized protein n=1 Tax=Streptomyces synnematoformans TaxID=415721 RepID=A0ABN2ZAZ3_9ACTN